MLRRSLFSLIPAGVLLALTPKITKAESEETPVFSAELGRKIAKHMEQDVNRAWSLVVPPEQMVVRTFRTPKVDDYQINTINGKHDLYFSTKSFTYSIDAPLSEYSPFKIEEMTSKLIYGMVHKFKKDYEGKGILVSNIELYFDESVLRQRRIGFYCWSEGFEKMTVEQYENYRQKLFGGV